MEPQRAVVPDVKLMFDVFVRNPLVTAVTTPTGALTYTGLARAVRWARKSASPDFCEDHFGHILRDAVWAPFSKPPKDIRQPVKFHRPSFSGAVRVR